MDIAPHCRPGAARTRRARLRVGFASHHLCHHTIGTLMRGFIERLSRDMVEVLVFPVRTKDDAMAAAIARAADHAVPLSGRLADCRAAIAAAELDVLVYPDVGMDPTTYFLSFARLAPVQCAMWGHPVTTGVPAMDVFLSARDLEPEGAEAHYTERLERLSRLPVFYHRPDLTGVDASRQRLGLPADRRLYVCPQTLFKLHPDFDAILGEILRRDGRGELVLIGGQSRHWEAALRARFARAFPDVCDRVRVIPPLVFRDFLGLLATADAILDPVHFTGGNSSYEAFALGAPVVTWPSGFMRGRVTYACYRQMGVMDCVATSAESYVELALRLAGDAEWRGDVSGRIRAAHGQLFEDPTPVREMEQFFIRASADAQARLA
jgi:predicted O-linked N-acetylglucosamine transferase (SPINDLY family)